MGWLIAAAVLAGLCLLPLGVRGVYDGNGGAVYLTVGPVSVQLYPAKKRKEKKASPEKPQSKENKSAEKTPGRLSDFRPLLDVALSLLGELRRRICVKNLEMCLILSGDDPADLAINCGRSWALLGNLVPQLDNLFRIKKRRLSVNCDFMANEPMFYGNIHISITVGRLLAILIRYGFRGIKEYQNITNQRKGGAKL